MDLVIRRLSSHFGTTSNLWTTNEEIPRLPRLRGSQNTRLIRSILFILVTRMAPNFCALPLITPEPSAPLCRLLDQKTGQAQITSLTSPIRGDFAESGIGLDFKGPKATTSGKPMQLRVLAARISSASVERDQRITSLAFALFSWPWLCPTSLRVPRPTEAPWVRFACFAWCCAQ